MLLGRFRNFYRLHYPLKEAGLKRQHLMSKSSIGNSKIAYDCILNV